MIRPTIFCLLIIALGCDTPRQDVNPAAQGFNISASDKEAIAIADRIMEAMGGRKAWDDTKILGWQFGSRHLIWDKHTGDVRVDAPKDSAIYLLNTKTEEIQALVKGETVAEPDSVQKYREKAMYNWINDSYWLVMPFKLKDSGVTLAYEREDTTQAGVQSDVLSLTFAGVGVTPENKYEVWVDRSDNLVKQWSYYRNASDSIPYRVWPWDNYSKYGEILLSAERSDGRGPKQVYVYDSLPPSVFEDFAVPAQVHF